MEKGKFSPVASQEEKQSGLPDGQPLLYVLYSAADTSSSIMSCTISQLLIPAYDPTSTSCKKFPSHGIVVHRLTAKLCASILLDNDSCILKWLLGTKVNH